MISEVSIYRFRLRTLALAEERGKVHTACPAMGIHHSTLHRWKRQAVQYRLELLRQRERRRPQMASANSPLAEQRVVAFALGRPGYGPARIAAELVRPKSGSMRLSANGVWRVLKRHGLNTQAKSRGLVAGSGCGARTGAPPPQLERHPEVARPSELVHFDCFHVGRLSGTQGHRLAIHRDRCGLGPLLGRAAHHAALPGSQMDLAAGPPRGSRPGRARLEAEVRDE